MAYIYDLTDTWNAGGTTFNAIKMNVTDSASAAGSKLVTLQTNGTEHFSVTKAGVGYFSGSLGIGTSSILSPLTVANGDISLGLGNGIRFYNSSNTNWSEIYNPSGGQMAFVSGAGEAMRIGTDGEVSIASTSSVYTAGNRGNLTIGGSASSLLFLGTGGTTGTYLAHFQSSNSVELWNGANGHMAFGTNNTERMRISSTGIVGIGVVPGANDFTGTVQTGWVGHGITPRTSTNLVFNMNANHSSGDWRYGNSGAAALYIQSDAGHAWYNAPSGTAGNVISFNEAMRITSAGNVGIGTTAPISGVGLTIGNDGNSSATVKLSFSTSATERAFISMAGGSGEMRYSAGYGGYGGFSTFYTAGSERARIDSSGNLLVGTTSAPGAGNMRIASNGSSASIQLERTGTSAGTGYIGADVNNCLNAYDGSLVQRFYVTQAGACYNSTGTYGTISDAKLKENIQDAPNFLDDLGLVRVVKYSLKSEGLSEADKIGVIAQELEEVFPEMIEEFLDVDGTGEKIKAVKYSVFIPVLVKAIQELTARVAQLEGN